MSVAAGDPLSGPSRSQRRRSAQLVTFRRFLSLLALATAAAVLPSSAGAQAADVIRGRVIGPDSLPVEGVAVSATSLNGNVTRSARTDRNGRFSIVFANGEGDYMMSFSLLGFAQKRFEVKRVGDEEILVADALLQRAAARLEAVTVNAPREKVNRNSSSQPDIGGTERPIEPGAVAAAELGDLAAMAASLPGVLPVPGEEGGANGFSVLGLGADQNSTTLNGMGFEGSNLPRDAQVSSSLTTSPYDVSRGGFSGAQFSLRSRPGSNYINRGLSMVLDAPQLQWTDRAARALGQRYSNVSLSGNVSGPIRFDKAFYNVAYQLGRRASDLQSLLDTDEAGLQASGVSADSVGRLLDILAQEGIPTTAGLRGDSRLSDQGSLFGTFDVSPPSSTSGQAFNVTMNGSWNRQNPVSVSTVELPSHGGERTDWNAGATARHTNYFGFGILSETSLGAGQQRNHSSPFLAMSSGRVLVNSTFDDGSNGLRQLAFGGSPSTNSSTTTGNASFSNQLSWFSASNRHRLKLTTELRHESTALEQASNLFGTFSFNSLADLQDGVPASFTRQLSPRQRDIGQLTGAVSLGDAFRYSPTLQLQYGVRVDANRFLDDPAFNAEVERVFGRRNDVSPDNVFVSPRLGFSWTYGQAAEIGAFEGAQRGPRAVLRGGIGMFQNSTRTGLIGGAIDNTGLPSAVQQLVCIGPAAPVPDWAAYAADPSTIPEQCADGTSGTVFANSSPNVTLFSPDYAPSRSLRSNLSWNGPVARNRFRVSADVTYSRNMNQQGSVDLNFDPVQRFALADEGGRPVYVEPTSIVPATGAIASRDARRSPAFNRVSEIRSDLLSETAQLSLGIAPIRYSSSFTWRVNYTLSDMRERVRGFSSTVGNPLDVEWARGSMNARHQVNYSLGYNVLDAVRVNWTGAFRSGRPFTPTIATDVNGDGYANDRAFIFDPAATADPALASGIAQLLASGSREARECLAAQLGTLAGRNSCSAPWTSTANLSISFNPVKVRMPQRASLSFNLSNPLGAADLLLHGEDGLRGWGQQASPDQALLYVRGFDRTTNRYRYEVNQRFGATNPAFSAIRAPVTLTAMVRFDIGPTRERQSLTQQLDRGRKTEGERLPEGILKNMYASGGIANPLATILRQQDTLGLTPVQADSIATLNRKYTVRLDSIWSPVAKYLGALPERYDQDEAYDRYRSARRASVDLLIGLAPTVRQLLTDEQRRRLPPMIASLLDPRYLASIRNGTAGMGGGGGMMGGGMGAMGGGERTVIIRQ